MPELPEVEITARRLDAALAGAEVESTLAPGMVAVKTVDPPLSALEGRSVAGVRRIGKMPVVRFEGDGEPLELLDPPDVGRAAAALRQARLAEGPALAGADPARRRARAAVAGVRDQAARLGEAASRRPGSRGRDGRHARSRGVAGAAARHASGGGRSAAPSAPPAAGPARDRRDRPVLGRRGPLGGAPVAVQEGLGARGRGGRAASTTASRCSGMRSTTTRR